MQMSHPRPARSPFHNLPIELCHLIFTYAARPIFTPNERLCFTNPYTSALALCRVSRTVRRAVLPELLHTVLLERHRKVSAFVHALSMQKVYAKRENHLRFDYAGNVCRIWIEECGGSYMHLGHDIDFSLLAPVLIASKSLAVDSRDLFLIVNRFQHHSNIDESSPPSWSTTTLTVSFDRYFPRPIDMPMNTIPESTLLASISHVIFLAPREFHFDPMSLPVNSGSNYRLDYRLGRWMDNFPWTSLKSLQSVSLVLPRIHIPYGSSGPYLEVDRKDVHVKLLTFSAPIDFSGQWQDKILFARAATEGPRVEWVDVRATVTFGIKNAIGYFRWEQAWACRLST
jgi:hypothetical protein